MNPFPPNPHPPNLNPLVLRLPFPIWIVLGFCECCLLLIPSGMPLLCFLSYIIFFIFWMLIIPFVLLFGFQSTRSFPQYINISLEYLTILISTWKNLSDNLSRFFCIYFGWLVVYLFVGLLVLLEVLLSRTFLVQSKLDWFSFMWGRGRFSWLTILVSLFVGNLCAYTVSLFSCLPFSEKC